MKTMNTLDEVLKIPVSSSPPSFWNTIHARIEGTAKQYPFILEMGIVDLTDISPNNTNNIDFFAMVTCNRDI